MAIAVDVAGDNGGRSRMVKAQLAGMVRKGRLADKGEGVITSMAGIGVDGREIDVVAAGRKVGDPVAPAAGRAVGGVAEDKDIIARPAGRGCPCPARR